MFDVLVLTGILSTERAVLRKSPGIRMTFLIADIWTESATQRALAN